MLVDIGLGLGAVGLATDTFALSDDRDTQLAGRITGWTLFGTFAASALYGGYVTLSCSSSSPADRQRAKERERLAPAKAAGFPSAVLQFQFGTRPDVASRACVATQGAFEAAAAASICRSPSPSLARPDARLEFRAGALSSITLVYPTTTETLRATLAQIGGQAASYYGQPRSGPTPWSPTCASNAAQCLKDGELPGRAFWSFANGEIELRPSLEQDSPHVELRYALYDPSFTTSSRALRLRERTASPSPSPSSSRWPDSATAVVRHSATKRRPSTATRRRHLLRLLEARRQRHPLAAYHEAAHCWPRMQGRTTVMQWCFAAVSTVAPTLQCIETIEIFDHYLRTRPKRCRAITHIAVGARRR
jgi:hypothetical protein